MMNQRIRRSIKAGPGTTVIEAFDQSIDEKSTSEPDQCAFTIN